MEARIESMGYEVGYRLVERTCQRRWMGGDQLEAIKFVCKDLWSDVSEGNIHVSILPLSSYGEPLMMRTRTSGRVVVPRNRGSCCVCGGSQL